ncbi:acyl dehydratase [Nocardioides marinisabuli]|uniref:Acyl dehydratase n=1 Tax=Nocardioides marinisabuli TaxID=419476 RepID=A0A7Y9JR18_9ACTN|nr:MaoC family dehydratase [Nocardioides marinisabuli]NYD57158.1 acyl dehydratase [Nocardioides marinisabuli]
MAPLTVDIADMASAVGAEIGPSGWLLMEQSRINAFADATGDHQWIHVDEERAASGPFGATVAHGYLTLAMVPQLLAEILHVTGRTSGVNYGMEKVRFISPVREGARIRMSGRIAGATPRAGGIQYRLEMVIELEGSEKPAMVGEFLVLAFP